VWWNTLHQGRSVFRLDGPSIDSSLLRPLLVMALGALLLFLTLLISAMRNEIHRRRLRAMRLAQAGATA
jgi:heme exporter protein C